MGGRRSHGQFIKLLCLTILIERETTGGVQAKFIVRSELKSLVGQWRISDDGRGIRTAMDHFRGVQLTKTKDHRTMIYGSVIVNE